MIKFFRKIRHRMLTENKFRNYLIYAIGEIILVVIGILIALQINNWNENRKSRDSERILLGNIQNDINQDTLDLGFNRTVHKKALENEILLLRLLDKDPNVTSDSINYIDALSVQVIAVIHKSSFNNLTYNNPDLISNKLLKQKIDRHYDFFYTALTEAQNNQSEYNFYSKLLPYYKKHFYRNDKKIKFEQRAHGSKDYFDYEYDRNLLQPIDINSMQKDNEFSVELSEVIFLRSALLSAYDEAISRINILNTDIEKELNKK